jgi:hypothetical protein
MCNPNAGELTQEDVDTNHAERDDADTYVQLL